MQSFELYCPKYDPQRSIHLSGRQYGILNLFSNLELKYEGLIYKRPLNLLCERITESLLIASSPGKELHRQYPKYLYRNAEFMPAHCGEYIDEHRDDTPLRFSGNRLSYRVATCELDPLHLYYGFAHLYSSTMTNLGYLECLRLVIIMADQHREIDMLLRKAARDVICSGDYFSYVNDRNHNVLGYIPCIPKTYRTVSVPIEISGRNIYGSAVTAVARYLSTGSHREIGQFISAISSRSASCNDLLVDILPILIDNPYTPLTDIYTDLSIGVDPEDTITLPL